MSGPPTFYFSLLRPCIIQILRAAGYHAAKPSVVDALTSIVVNYMATLCREASDFAELNHNSRELTVQDVRMAMADMAQFSPQMSIEDEIMLEGGEDVRGVEEWVKWATGDANKEIGRVGLGEGKEDFLEQLVRKQDMEMGGGEESRWDGTVLGREAPPREVIAEGWEGVTNISEWNKRQREKNWKEGELRAKVMMKTGEKQGSKSTTRQSSELSDVKEVEDVPMEDVEAS